MMGRVAFLVVGESLVDLISEPDSWQFEAAPGGSPLNVAVGLAAAGHGVRLASEVGDDLFGHLVRSHLTRYGVGGADLVPSAATGLAIARLDSSGGAEYDFRLGWTWAGRPDLAGVECLHVGSLGAVVEPGAAAVRETVAAARRRGIPVSYDPNVRPALMGPDAPARIEEQVAMVDIVKVSREDLAWLRPGIADVDAAAGWLDRGPWLVVVTRGAEGAVAVQRGPVIECPAEPVTVVDTVGAGDAFTAGLLSSLARADALGRPSGDAVVAALRHASRTAAAACAHRGAAPAVR
jgi:fructokinase